MASPEIKKDNCDNFNGILALIVFIEEFYKVI